MKVLHVVGGLSETGGVYSVASNIASSNIAGIEHYIWMHRDFTPSRGKCSYVCQGAVKTVTATITHDLVGAFREALPLCRYVKKTEPLVLHAHSRVGMWAASIVHLMTSVPLVAHVHVLAGHSGFYKQLWKWTRPLLVFNSNATCKHFGFDPSLSFVVPPSIQWPKVPPSDPLGGDRLISAGLYVPLKNFDKTVTAAAAIAEQRIPVPLIIFGAQEPPLNGAFMYHLQELSRNKDYITLAPWSNDWTDQLCVSDIFIHMASPESFGIVILEAFARGLRLVVCAETFLDSLPEPQRNLGVFRVRNASGEALLEQIHLALACKLPAADLWQTRREVADLFDSNRNAQRYMDIYRRLFEINVGNVG